MYTFFKLMLIFLFAGFANGSQKTRIKELFQELGDENIDVHPQLIRMAFHDAAHFDQNDGQYRMGCFVEIIENAIDCPAHNHMDEAIDLRKAIFDQLVSEEFNPSHADLTQLLGALAVDRLSVETSFTGSLYDQVRMGRVDIDNCDDVCENLPDFAAGGPNIEERLGNVWVFDIKGKMEQSMGFSELEAVALLGAHTVGRVRGQFSCAGCDGPWTTTPFIFDNSYFQELQAVAENAASCTSPLASECLSPFSNVFPTWFRDVSRFVNWMDQKLFATGSIQEISEVSEPPSDNVLTPLMTDADMALWFNRPDFVSMFAGDLDTWRNIFDQAYVKMSELGCEESISGFQLLDDLDVDESQPQPIIDIPCPTPLCANIGLCPQGSSVGIPTCEGECCISCPCCFNEAGSCVPDCPNVFFPIPCPNGRVLDLNGCETDECVPLDFNYQPLGNGNDGFCRDSNGEMQMLQDYDLDTEAECKELCDNIFACAGYQYGRSGKPVDCNLYFAADSVSTHTSTNMSCRKKLEQMDIEGYVWRGPGFCRREDGLKFHLVGQNRNTEWECKLFCDANSMCAGFSYGTNSNPLKCNLYAEAGAMSSTKSLGGCWAKI
jgi:hypothetical protein